MVTWKGKRVVVGGGCGFLGSYLVPELVAAGAQVTVVDDLSNGVLSNLDLSGDNPTFVKADLGDLEMALEVTRGQDILLNMAARAFGMEYSRFHDGQMLVSNLLCTLAPLEAARVNRLEQVLIVSSSCVYPDEGVQVPTPELDAFTEKPESVNEGYGWAKRVQELAGMYYERDHDIRVSIVRPFNMYGGNYIWGSEEKAHVIPSLVKKVMDGDDPLVVWGSGQQERNFIHGSDAARLIRMVVELEGTARPVNIGFEDTVTIRELVELICDVAGRTPKVVFDPSKPEGRAKKSADSRLLRQIVGEYEQKLDLREGLADMIRWYERTFAGK